MRFGLSVYLCAILLTSLSVTTQSASADCDRRSLLRRALDFVLPHRGVSYDDGTPLRFGREPHADVLDFMNDLPPARRAELRELVQMSRNEFDPIPGSSV